MATRCAGRCASGRGPTPVRIVALTGWGQERDRSQSRDAGFDAHLVKPVDYDTLMRTITEV